MDFPCCIQQKRECVAAHLKFHVIVIKGIDAGKFLV
jgi:hypothetical protein